MGEWRGCTHATHGHSRTRGGGGEGRGGMRAEASTISSCCRLASVLKLCVLAVSPWLKPRRGDVWPRGMIVGWHARLSPDVI